MTKRLTVEAQGTYSYETVKNRPALSDSPSNIGNALIGIAPNFDQKWLAANYKTKPDATMTGMETNTASILIG